MSLEWAALADIFDLTVAAHTKKGSNPKPYARPWSAASRRPEPIDPELKQLLARNAGREVEDLGG